MKELLLFRHRANIHPDSIPVKTTAESTTRFLSDALPTNGRIHNDAAAWNDQPMGTRWPRRYHEIDLAGRECFYEGTFTPVPLHQNQTVLVVLQDLNSHVRLASEVDISSLCQTVFARVGKPAVSEVPVQSMVNEAVHLTVEA